MEAFAGNVHFAWQMLYSEIMLESAPSLQTPNLIKLIELYSVLPPLPSKDSRN
jgi:hypothetical protein